MLDPQLFRTDLEGVQAALAARGYKLDIEAFRRLEEERKAVQVRTQELQAKRNSTSKQIGIAKSKGEDASALMAEVAGAADELKACEAQLEALQTQLRDLMLDIPNLPHASVP